MTALALDSAEEGTFETHYNHPGSVTGVVNPNNQYNIN